MALNKGLTVYPKSSASASSEFRHSRMIDFKGYSEFGQTPLSSTLEE